jgi:hypothetical protein
MEVSDQLHAPATLPQGKSPWYPGVGMRNIIIDLKETEREAVDLIQVAENRIQWLARVNMVMSFRVP